LVVADNFLKNKILSNGLKAKILVQIAGKGELKKIYKRILKEKMPSSGFDNKFEKHFDKVMKRIGGQSRLREILEVGM